MKQLVCLTIMCLIFKNCQAVYQEAKCQRAGGMCKYDTNCNGGRLLIGYCPTQPVNIKCCVGGANPYDEPKCTNVGGHCRYNTDCNGGTLLTGYCPTQPVNIKCCVYGG